MSEITSGLYTIVSAADKSQFIGGNDVEDYSLLPKKVVVHPPGAQPRQIDWIIEKLPNGHYKLKIGGVPVGPQDGKIFAFYINEDNQKLEWIITERNSTDTSIDFNVYTIELPDSIEGWATPEGTASPESFVLPQIEVRALISTKSFPPLFLPKELFSILPIHRNE